MKEVVVESYRETVGDVGDVGDARLSADALWQLVNIPGAVTLRVNRRGYGPPPGVRGTLKRFGYRHAIVAFPDYAPLEYLIADLGQP